MLTAIIYFLLITPFVISSVHQGEVVQTQSGSIRGIIQSSSLSGISVQKFLNIPYAEAPVGELRFEKPRPKKLWNGTLNSTEEIIACIQPSQLGLTIKEDCLVLSVWTPFPRPQNASVMVWIHGGAFRFGNSGESLGPNLVAIGNVILVGINYRLTALGFLSTGDDRIKGNLGLYDQRLAIKWVKDNIESFGGNPNSITLFGESAGAASVSAHALSKESWKYFDKAIFQSGNMLMPLAIMTDAQIKDGLKWFLKKAKCNNDDKLLECLRNVSEDKWKEILDSDGSAGIWTGPVVDKEFISEHPQKLWAKREVKNQSVIIGVTKDEWFYIEQKLLQRSKNVSVYFKYFETKLEEHFKNSSKAVYEKARELYQPKCIPSYLEALKPIVAFVSDRLFICDSRREAKLRATLMNSKDMYVFQYSHTPLVPYIPNWYPYGVYGFSAHGLDIVSVFGAPINNTKFRPDDQTLSMRMILYWTNFAKTGDPNVGIKKLPFVVDNVDSLPAWPRYNEEKEEFLDMESFSQMTVRAKLREIHCDFLMDPEGFLERQVASSSTKDFFTVHVLFIMFQFSLYFA